MSASSNPRLEELSRIVAEKVARRARQIYERRDLFLELIKSYPEGHPISKEEVCNLLRFDVAGNSFYNFTAQLRKDGVITYKQAHGRPGIFQFKILNDAVSPAVSHPIQSLKLKEEPPMDNDNPEITYTYSLKQLEDLAIRFLVLEGDHYREGCGGPSVQDFLRYLKSEEEK